VTSDAASTPDAGDLGAYCREVEAHLCRRNHGHLVRVVGPAFDCVAGWAARGIPLRVACRGIDRCVERLEAKGPRRRPVRIEFCDADVRDVFDEWRRAVGVGSVHASGDDGDETAPTRRHESLAAHLERVVARLTVLRAGGGLPLGEVVDPLVAELDAARGTAKGLRGEPRRELLERLRAMDGSLLAAVRSRLDRATLASLGDEADTELAAFRDRMPADAYASARLACIDRLLRDRYGVPVIALD
jgi:hypothetical protein